ncbi:DUF1573 domain-containing protein [Mesonia ostreae]|uniref:DUF1573 domain-containing protein n=1 Tax=Mesonia ostreae TaxID=861110 RepID=A0ABU2KM05_9FLAO|nr:DUF1573 domain-containing protein [Mesonia ostreae]MDT0295707.1 DUF1573 domain-containing protein [Mesonia ostreae]
MKKGFLMLAAVAAMVFTSCKDNAADKVNEENQKEVAERDANSTGAPVMKFDNEMHDFGTINEGDVVEHTFMFENTGDSPLVVSNAKGSCGCTVPTWSKEPIAPGEKGEMVVKFNSNGKPNNQMKTIRITANTESGQEMIKIKSFVTPKAGGAKTGNPVNKVRKTSTQPGHEGHNHD